MNASDNLSDFDLMKNIRLPDWGFWGRDDDSRPDPEAGCGTIYQLGKQDETERDPDAAPEVRRRINVKDCEWLNELIGQKLAMDHRHVICGYFYKRKEQFRHRVPAAIRALLDVEYASQP